MYVAFIGSRVQRSNGMLEVKVLGKNIWRLFYDSLRQSFWQCATSAWKRKSRNRIKSPKIYWIGWSKNFGFYHRSLKNWPICKINLKSTSSSLEPNELFLTSPFFPYLKMVSYLAKNIWSYKPLTQICIVPNCVNSLNFLFQANEIREAVDYKVIKSYFIKIC